MINEALDHVVQQLASSTGVEVVRKSDGKKGYVSGLIRRAGRLLYKLGIGGVVVYVARQQIGKAFELGRNVGVAEGRSVMYQQLQRDFLETFNVGLNRRKR